MEESRQAGFPVCHRSMLYTCSRDFQSATQSSSSPSDVSHSRTKLSEDSRKYGAENTCTSGTALFKAAMSYSSARMDIERERQNLLKALGTQGCMVPGRRTKCVYGPRLEGVKDLPMQVVWSGGWSGDWTEQGRQVAGVLHQATFVTHSGGRWPQIGAECWPSKKNHEKEDGGSINDKCGS